MYGDEAGVASRDYASWTLRPLGSVGFVAPDLGNRCGRARMPSMRSPFLICAEDVMADGLQSA